MLQQPTRPDIFSYADYKAFLADFYAYLKTTKRGFSLRKLAVRKPAEQLKGRGKNSPHYSAQFLNLVIAGKKDIPETMADPLGRAFGLNESELLFLRRLVKFQHSSDPDSKVDAYKRMAWRGKFRDAQGLGSRERLEFIAHGFIADVYQMTALPDFQATPTWFARNSYLRLGKTEIREALKVLSELDLIDIAADGKVTRRSAPPPMPSTGEPMLFRIYHMEQTEKARQALDSVPTEDRSFTTWGVSRFGADDYRAYLAELSQEIESTVERLTEKWADKDPQGKILAQINLQIFPVTHVGDGATEEQI